MTAVSGVNYTKAIAGGGDNILRQGTYGGRKRASIDTYEASALANASTIKMAKLPIGAQITGMKLYHDDMGSTVTASLGDSTSATRYLAATSVTSAGVQTANTVDGIGYVIGTASDDEIILVTTAGIFGGTLKLVVEYVVD